MSASCSQFEMPREGRVATLWLHHPLDNASSGNMVDRNERQRADGSGARGRLGAGWRARGPGWSGGGVGRRLRMAVCSVLVAAACGGKAPSADEQALEPVPALPLPTAGIAGQQVAVYPVTLVSAEEQLGWQPYLANRRDALARADSIIASMLVERSPEVTWVLPDELRRAAARAPAMLTSPDQMGTALLRSPEAERIPDPLRSQMRALNGVAADRYALVPAALLFRETPDGEGRAELTVVMVDVRTGLVGWRTMAHGIGADPWDALRVAFKTLTPGLP